MKQENGLKRTLNKRRSLYFFLKFCNRLLVEHASLQENIEKMYSKKDRSLLLTLVNYAFNIIKRTQGVQLKITILNEKKYNVKVQ